MLNSHQTSIFEELARCFPFNIVDHASPMKFNIGVEHASPMKTWMFFALKGGLSCMVRLKGLKGHDGPNISCDEASHTLGELNPSGGIWPTHLVQ
jgi:hypothetical protein